MEAGDRVGDRDIPVNNVDVRYVIVMIVSLGADLVWGWRSGLARH